VPEKIDGRRFDRQRSGNSQGRDRKGDAGGTGGDGFRINLRRVRRDRLQRFRQVPYREGFF
jgi:hypothetical protein